MDTRDSSSQTEEYQAEIAQYKEIIKSKPDALDTYKRWRTAIAALGFPKEELGEYLRTIEQNLVNPEDYNDLGFFLSEHNQDESALEVFQRALEKDPDNFYARFNSGISYHRLKKYEDAIEQYQKAQEINPYDARVYDGLGRAYHNLQEYQKAAEHYKKALSFNPDNIDVLYNHGLVLYYLGKYEEAIEQFQLATEKNPDFVNGFIEWGRCLDKLKKHEQAADKYRQALQRDSNNPTAHNNLGIAYFDLGKFEESLEEYDKALASDSEYAHLYHRNRGLALENLGKLEEAAESYRQAVAIYPEYVDAYNSWGLVLDKLGRREEAIEKYQQALQKDSGDATTAATHNRMGIVFYNLGKHQEALEQYEKALEHDREYSYVYYHNQGLVYEKMAKYEDAIDKYAEALKANPEYVAAYNSWGISLEMLGLFEEAIERYEKALAIDHDDKEFTLFNKGLALEKLSRFEEAIDEYKKAYDTNTEYPYSAHNLASLYERIGSLKKSAEWWEKTCISYKKSAEDARSNKDIIHFYNHARVYHYSFEVNFEKARSIYCQGLDLDQENISILFGLARLYMDLKNQEIAYNGDESLAETKARGHWKSKEYLGKLRKLLEKQVEEHKDENNLSQLGEVYYLLGENYYARAIDCLHQALEINENIQRAAELLGKIYLQKNRPKKAIEYFRQEQQISPDDLNIRSMEADACLRAKQEERAESIYREILEINSFHLDALLGLGEIYKLKGERDKETNDSALAEENFTQALDYYSKVVTVDKEYRAHLDNGLSRKKMAALIYSQAYVKVRIYEARPARSKNPTLLTEANRAYTRIKAQYKNSPYYYWADTAQKRISRHLQPSEESTAKTGARLIFIFACIVFVLAQFTFFIGQPVFSPVYVLSETKLQETVAAADKQNLNITPEIQEMLADLSNLQYRSAAEFNALVQRNFEAFNQKVQGPELQESLAFIKNEITTTDALQYRWRPGFFGLEPITPPYYALISFGALLFMVAALYLQEITHIKVGALELEKAPTEQISSSSSLVISRKASMDTGISQPH